MFLKQLAHSYASEVDDVAVYFLRDKVECPAVDILMPCEIFLSHRGMVIGAFLYGLDRLDCFAKLTCQLGKSRFV